MSRNPPPTSSDTAATSTAASAVVFARHFRLVQVVQAGDSVVVWQATDQRSGAPVALKFFPPDLIRTPADFLTVRNVIAPIRQLNHPGIVAAREVATDPEYSAIVTPWIDAPTLAELRQRQAQHCFAVSDIVPWVQTLVDVFECSHARGLVHGALSPHVIFVRPHEGLCVTGFGTNAWLRIAIRSLYGLPKSRDIAHPGYASPALLEGNTPTPADDIYAFGALLYELITGTVPRHSTWLVPKPPAMELQRRRQKRFGTPIPGAWERVVQDCLASDPARRIQDFQEIRTRLALAPATTPVVATGGQSEVATESPNAAAEKAVAVSDRLEEPPAETTAPPEIANLAPPPPEEKPAPAPAPEEAAPAEEASTNATPVLESAAASEPAVEANAALEAGATEDVAAAAIEQPTTEAPVPAEEPGTPIESVSVIQDSPETAPSEVPAAAAEVHASDAAPVATPVADVVESPSPPDVEPIEEWRPSDSVATNSNDEELSPVASYATIAATPTAAVPSVTEHPTIADEIDDEADEPALPRNAKTMEPLLPSRGPLRHVPTPADQPRVLFPRSSYYDRERHPAKPVVLRSLVVLTVLAAMAVGGLWGWRTYEMRQEYVELWRDVQLLPPDASAHRRALLEERIKQSRERLTEQQWRSLHAAWENHKANLPHRQLTGAPSGGVLGQ